MFILDTRVSVYNPRSAFEVPVAEQQGQVTQQQAAPQGLPTEDQIKNKLDMFLSSEGGQASEGSTQPPPDPNSEEYKEYKEKAQQRMGRQVRNTFTHVLETDAAITGTYYILKNRALKKASKEVTKLACKDVFLSGKAIAKIGGQTIAKWIPGIGTVLILVDNGIDIARAVDTSDEDKEEQKEEIKNAAWNVGLTGGGALAGAAIGVWFCGIGVIPGALIGAAVGNFINDFRGAGDIITNVAKGFFS